MKKWNSEPIKRIEGFLFHKLLKMGMMLNLPNAGKFSNFLLNLKP